MLFVFLSATVPLCILDIVLRMERIPPPRWLGDVLSLALLALAAVFLRRAWKPKEQGIAPEKRGSGRARDPVLACLAHEIRNYSSVLKGNARLLRSRLEGDAALEPLGRLERTTDKIEALAQEFLDTTAGAGHSDAEPLCLHALLESCLDDHFHEMRDRFFIEAEGPLPALAGDARKLERVFLNLFRNAWEAGARSIHVRLGQASGRLCLVVEDDGQGCPPEAIARLFQPHFTTKKGKGGTGLGLYVVKSIVEAHGGTVRAVSKNARPGGRTGMIFCLDFPVEGGEDPIKSKSRKPDWREIHSEA